MRKESVLLAITAMLLSGPCRPIEPDGSVPQHGASQPSAAAMSEYALAVRKRILPVTNALVTDGDKATDAVFPVEIDAEGNVLSITVKTSSGDSRYDNDCMEAIKNVGLPKPPQGMPLRLNLVVRTFHRIRDWVYRPVHAN
ncbi:TonB family protein [Paraburkholderia sp. 40]|uniref:TonB family protein n=1 Tax=Paraburkholderia sp. 40 TaxID=2991059 RepID=UPI003D2190AB